MANHTFFVLKNIELSIIWLIFRKFAPLKSSLQVIINENVQIGEQPDRLVHFCDCRVHVLQYD
jgi:hypothetical protein